MVEKFSNLHLSIYSGMVIFYGRFMLYGGKILGSIKQAQQIKTYYLSNSKLCGELWTLSWNQLASKQINLSLSLTILITFTN